MKRLFAKVRKVRRTCWNKLTLGEKIMAFVMSLIKVALIVAAGVAVAAVVVAVGFAMLIVAGFTSAITGGLNNASRAYRPGDRYVRFW